MDEMVLQKDYRNDDKLRASFNELAKKTFALDFEDWYQNGYWTHKYNPYSMVKDGKVIANVSVNLADYLWNGRRWKLLQLGTVMTDEEYRNRGLIRQIMEEIEKDYSESVDGMFLFANDSVLDFYPKFGFQKANEYAYVKDVTNTQDVSIEHASMENKNQWDVLEKYMEECAPYSDFEPVGYSELFLFYVTKFMQDAVFYDKEQDAYVIAEVDEAQLILHGVFAKKECDLDKLIASFGKEITQVRITFTPIQKEGYQVFSHQEEDCTLFVKGMGLEDFEKRAVRFPELGHA